MAKPTVLPIQFCIDETKFLPLLSSEAKVRAFSNLIPGKPSTYIYNDEKLYYKQYRESYYAFTTKKAGFDCMRHLEIIAAGCVPYFQGIDECPTLILNRFPKDLVKKAMALPGVSEGDINFDVFDKKAYDDIRTELYEYTLQHLTCRAMAKHVLQTVTLEVDHPALKVLFLSGHLYPDYQRCGILTGLKRILGSNVVDVMKVTHLYKSFTGDTSKLYGKGFSYAQVLEEDPDLIRDENVIQKAIEANVFDLVIYGSIHRGLPLHDLVLASYAPEKVVYICGEDTHSTDVCRKATRYGSWLFIREFQ